MMMSCATGFIIKTFKLPCILLCIGQVASAAGWDSWRHDFPCGRHFPIKEIDIQHCLRAVTSILPNGIQVSVCQATTGTYEKIHIQLSNGDKIIKKWDVQNNSSLSYDSVTVDAIDLNGDGKQEILIGLLDIITNRLAIGNWKIWAFDGTHLSKSLAIEDYGDLSMLVCSKNKRDKFLFASYRSEYESERKKSSDDFIEYRNDIIEYQLGYWLKLDHSGEFCMSSDRPKVYRSFSDISAKAGLSKKPWYQSPAAHTSNVPTSVQIDWEPPAPVCK
jgi:hypothetical protein